MTLDSENLLTTRRMMTKSTSFFRGGLPICGSGENRKAMNVVAMKAKSGALIGGK